MKANKSGSLQLSKVVAKEKGYTLKEKHVIVFLYCCMNFDTNIDSSKKVEDLICGLIKEFKSQPEITLLELESYAKINFDQLEMFLQDM